ncbi:MAG TPA: SDR family NAD(P)-dependent oxidoreductase [Polyangiales bacterium]|nr:SDR family NAD(P)-dependent oxidoreductase [Polyangiales bacterium]
MDYQLRGKNALITGGSRGLGLELARVLVDRGARVALVARDEAELARAASELRQRGSPTRVVTHACDLTDGSSIDAMLARVRDALGPIDVLINNAGLIQVGPLDAMKVDDFEGAMKLHCFAPLRTMLGVRASMRERGGGRIANIASIGGVVSVPHLLPYSASKFALVGLSQGMRAELARDRIYITTVAPGLMRTGSPRQAQMKGDHEREYAWFAVSDSLPLLSMSSERAAQKIVRALERGQPSLILGLPAKVAALANGIAPNLVSRALTLANRLLPRGGDPRVKLGTESESRWVPSPLTLLTQRAELRNNER